jgi:hypothetical protein
MRKSGKELERLVREIETVLLPKGFRVVPNEQVHNDNGVPIAEFDLHIEGTVGSTLFRWLIECRDRPSEGPAPGSWIEQLVGRRNRFRFNKVTAVSTTGFAPSANEFARQEGIELRAVSQITADAVSDWLTSTDLRLFRDKTELKSARLCVPKDTSQEIVAALESRIAGIKPVEAVLRSTKDGRSASIGAVCMSLIRQYPDIFNGVEPNKGPIARTVKANYHDPYDRFEIETTMGFIQINQIVFEAELSTTFELVPQAQIMQYSTNETPRPICQSIKWEFETPDRRIDLVVHRILSDSGAIIGVHTTASASTEQ